MARRLLAAGYHRARTPIVSSRPPTVLLVGQGPPVTGGIPSFIATLLEDQTVRLDWSARSPLYRVLLRATGAVVDCLVVVSSQAERVARRLVPRVIRIE